MITTLSKQGGRRYPQMGSTGQPWAGVLPSVGSAAVVVTPNLKRIFIDLDTGHLIYRLTA